MRYYIDKSGAYYEGDRQGTDHEVPQRPSARHRWDGAGWQYAPDVADYETAVQAHLDAVAKARGYYDVLSACSYAGAVNPFQAEGTAFVAWRGAVWAHCYQALNDLENGKRTAPTEAELIAELPALVLP